MRHSWRMLAAAMAACALVLVLFAGCSGDWDDDYYDDYRDRPNPQKTMFIYLNVSDPDGDPLPGVTVWVDGTQQESRSDDELEHLGNQFPSGWRGWAYNWSGGPYWFDVRDCGGSCRIEIIVSRSGYQSQRTHITFDRYDPDEIYMRQTFVMEPSEVGTASVVDAPRKPEMISLEQ